MNIDASWRQRTDQELVEAALKDCHAFTPARTKLTNERKRGPRA